MSQLPFQVDDTHKRWNSQSPESMIVWQKYKDEIAPQIVQSALAKPNCKLIDLYQVLSVARLRCEFEKHSIPDKLDFASKSKFGLFNAGQSTAEFNIFNGVGDLVERLLKSRIQSNRMYFGLSVLYSGKLIHLDDNINVNALERLEPIFQQLIHTEDFFDFIQLSGKMMYELSNFPQITRGSAAVNSWLLDSIMQAKFGISNLRPLLYDWTAFFEMPDQYLGFYVPSVTANYLKTISSIYSQDTDFFDSLPALMIKNPNEIENLQARKEAWKKIKDYVDIAIQNPELTNEQKKHLESIQSHDFEFRFPQESIVKFVHLIKDYPVRPLTKEIICNMMDDSGCSIEILEQIITFSQVVNPAYFRDLQEYEMFNTLSSDIEILRLLTIRDIEAIRSILFPTLNYFEYTASASKYSFFTVSASAQTLAEISFTTIETLREAPDEILQLLEPPETLDTQETKELKANVKEAIWSGGVTVQELIKLNSAEIAMITTPEALSLYKENCFIRAQDVLDIAEDALALSEEKQFNDIEHQSFNINQQREIKSAIQSYKKQNSPETNSITIPKR